MFFNSLEFLLFLLTIFAAYWILNSIDGSTTWSTGIELAHKDRVSYLSMEAVTLPDSLYFDADHVNGNGMTWLSDTLSRIITPSNNGVN